tara:strand:+ start:123 stop:428 length:306 start_codon:yes stop_codon:yes gene_type:complete
MDEIEAKVNEYLGDVWQHCMSGVRARLQMPKIEATEERLAEAREKTKKLLEEQGRRIDVINGFYWNEEGDKVWFDVDPEELAAAKKWMKRFGHIAGQKKDS